MKTPANIKTKSQFDREIEREKAKAKFVFGTLLLAILITLAIKTAKKYIDEDNRLYNVTEQLTTSNTSYVNQ